MTKPMFSTHVEKLDDESMATYIYRTVIRNYNEMNPPTFQRFLEQMLFLCQDMDKGSIKKDSVKE